LVRKGANSPAEIPSFGYFDEISGRPRSVILREREESNNLIIQNSRDPSLRSEGPILSFFKDLKLDLTNDWNRKRIISVSSEEGGDRNENTGSKGKGKGSGAEKDLWIIKDGIDPKGSEGRREF
jgi:hypothetical protein